MRVKFVGFRTSSALKLTWGSPSIPYQIRNYGGGIIAPPNPPHLDNFVKIGWHLNLEDTAIVGETSSTMVAHVS